MREADEGFGNPPEGLGGVVDLLLDVIEGCLAFCWEVGTGNSAHCHINLGSGFWV